MAGQTWAGQRAKAGQGELHDWRAAQLIRLGFPRPLAEAVADHVDWHEIAALVHRDCGPRLALNIVL